MEGRVVKHVSNHGGDALQEPRARDRGGSKWVGDPVNVH